MLSVTLSSPAALAAQSTEQAATPTATLSPPARMSGKVLDAKSGRPVRIALVGVTDVGLWTKADATGDFTLSEIPPGSQELIVRAIGYSPVHVRTEFLANDSLTMQVALTPVSPTLSAVRVEAEFEARYATRLQQFEESRSLGAGRFLDWRFFEQHKHTSVSTLLHGRFAALRVGLAETENGNGFMITRSGTPCTPQMWVNGLRGDGGLRLHYLNTSDVLGFEFYTPSTTPARYNATGGTVVKDSLGGTSLEPKSGPACGTVVLWLK